MAIKRGQLNTQVKDFLGINKWKLLRLGVLSRFSFDFDWISYLSPNKPYPSPRSGTSFLHSTSPWHYYGRNITLWLHFYSAIFHSQLDLVPSDLLHVRIFTLGCADFDNHVFGNYDFVVLLPSGGRRLQLVVEVFYDFRIHSCLLFRLCCTLLLFKSKINS